MGKKGEAAMTTSEKQDAIKKWRALEAMPVGHDFEVYHLLDEHYEHSIFHIHSYYEFYIFLHGSVGIMIEDQEYDVSPYDFFLFPPGYMHRNRPHARDNLNYERAYFYLTENMLQSMDSQDCSLSGIIAGAVKEHRFHYHLSRQTCEELVRRMDRIIETEGSTNPIDLCINRARMMILVASLCGQMQTDISHAGVPVNSIAASVLQYLNQHLTESVSLDQLADMFFVNKYHMLHEFKEKTGTSIHQYLLMKRIVYAQMLMKNGASSVQAAHDSGFEDYTGFYRAFKSRTGYAPTEYIRYLGRTADD